MNKPDRTYARAVIMGAVLYPLAVALISILAGEYASLFTVPCVSDAWAQPATPDQPVTPPAQQEEQTPPQPSQEQTGPKPPEASPPESPQPLPEQPSPEQKQPEQQPEQQPEKKPEQKQPEKETPGKPPEYLIEKTIIDMVHDAISQRLLSTATYFDSFFGNQRYLAELNESYVRVRYNWFLEHESAPLLRPDLQIRIVLPQLREATHLEFAGTPRETASVTNPTQAPSTIDQFQNPGDKSFTTSVSQFLRDTKRVNFVVRAGLQWHKGGPVVILGPRFRILVPLGDLWNFRFVEEVILRNDRGWQATHTFDLERPLPSGLFFRFTNSWLQTDHVDGFVYTFIFNVAQHLTPTKALEYEEVNTFVTQPVNELTEVDLRVRYRQQIWRKWLYFEVAPQYRFPRDRGFEPTPGILFRLEAIFGHF